MVRDGLVVGLSDLSLLERLQMDPDLKLQKKVYLTSSDERVKKRAKIFHFLENLLRL